MLINLRNALMAGKRLPYDAEVEYLESTGTQWIDTGVAFSQLYTFKLCARLTPTVNERDLFGAYLQTETNKMVCGCYNRFIFGFNPPGARIDSATLGTSELDVDIAYAFSSAGRALTVNGTTYSATGAYTNGLNVTLFRANPGYDGSFKCYSFKIYDTDGTTLLRDYIPVRKGTVGYLYDRVSGKLFGNAGTGDFVIGQDVVPVEYIQSHGTEWIDTGRHIPADFWFDATMDITGTNSAWKTLLGARVDRSVNDYQFSFQGSKLLARYGNNDPQYFGTLQTGMARIRVESGGKLYINESFEKQLGVDSPPALNMYIFALNENGAVSQYANYIRLNSLKYGGANEEHAFLPVRVGTDATSWEGAMMDVLTRRIYRNAGKGAFTYGNDLKYPIPA